MKKELSNLVLGLGVAGALLAGSDAHAGQEAFRFKNERSDVVRHAKRIGIEPELLMAVRMTENGSDKVAYGILPSGKGKEKYDTDKGYMQNTTFIPYKNDVEKQMCWAGWTIRKRHDEFTNMSSHQKRRYKDFIDYLGNSYAPLGVSNDANNLNQNWQRNFRHFYAELKK